MRVKCLVEYDGSSFFGYQKQPDFITVQGEIERVLRYICKSDVIIHSSGRTDRGVHAKEQCFHFDTNIENINFKEAINSNITNGISILDYEYIDDNFHARYNVKSKEYRYFISYKKSVFTRKYAHFLKNKLDYKKIKEVIKEFEGKHDFVNFCVNDEKDTNRTIFEADVIENNNGLMFTFKGNGFLKYMIRILVGTLVMYSKGKLSKEDLLNRLKNQKKDTFPKFKIEPEGLYLYKVNY